MIDLYDLIYSALPKSAAYREIVAKLETRLPDWVVPLSSVDRALLDRVAAEMRVGRGDTFVDLACGLGGPALWIAGQTGASPVGIDFSAAAIKYASALAAELDIGKKARFFARDATRTELADASIDAVMSIDSLQFIEPRTITTEIARILKPGGRAAVITWEALIDVEMPTVVRDYRPYFDSAGLSVQTHEIVEGARARELAQYRLLLESAPALRSEMGEAAEPLLDEAASGLAREHSLPRVQKVFIAASKRTR